MPDIELLVVSGDGLDVAFLAATALHSAIEDAYDDPPDVDELLGSVTVRYRRVLEDGRQIAGVTLYLELEEALLGEAVTDLLKHLEAEDAVFHLVKLQDAVQLAAEHRYLDEIYRLEMLLREALTVIFVRSGLTEYYDLLSQSRVEFPGGSPEQERMEKYAENQFFHLYFSGYREVGSRRLPTKVTTLITLVVETNSYEELRDQLSPSVRLEAEDETFLASLKAGLEPIEQVRNCVMHNRSVSNTQVQNYRKAYDELIERVNEFLSSLHVDG